MTTTNLQTSALTSAQLADYLTAIQVAPNAGTRDAAVITAASAVQKAILTRSQSPEELLEVLDTGWSSQFAGSFQSVLNRVVSVADMEDHQLVTWLFPVAIRHTESLPHILDLETKSLNALKMNGCIQQQLGLAPSAENPDMVSWVYAVPQLYSLEAAQQADLGELVTLPQQARDYIRGTVKIAPMLSNRAPEGYLPAGTSLYFLAVVARHPKGTIKAAGQSERVSYRLLKWLAATLTAHKLDGAVKGMAIPGGPRPFASAVHNGNEQQFEARLTAMLGDLEEQVGVSVKTMTAKVAPYMAAQLANDYVIGITVASRLTGAYLASLTLMPREINPEQAVAIAIRVLHTMGIEKLESQAAAIESQVCHHCGKLQYSLPTAQEDAGRMAVAH